MRVLHLPRSIGANAYNLSVGERKNGIDSKVMIYDPSMYSSGADFVIKYSKNKKILYAIKAILFCIKSKNKYDVFHYNYGTAIIHTRKKWLFGLDVKFFRKANKVIAVTYQGGDSRQADYCLKNYETTFYTEDIVKAEKANDEMKRFRISFFDRYADLIYSTNPDLLNILPERAKFRPYTKLQPDEWEPCYSDYKKEKTVILHAPTRTHIKGTEYVDAAVARLKEEGYQIEYLMLQNIPNAEVIEYYKKADLVVDQLLIGWYGGFAVECMALGKPVMCYIRESDMRHIPDEMNRDMPIIRVTKDSLYDQMKYYLDHKEELSEIARQSRQYVEKWHDPKKIAKGIIKDYQRVLDKKKKK